MIRSKKSVGIYLGGGRKGRCVEEHSNVPAYAYLYAPCDSEHRLRAIAYACDLPWIGAIYMYLPVVATFRQQAVAIFGRGGRSSEVTQGPLMYNRRLTGFSSERSMLGT
jgi:hypothetical protein